jgi:hypothetical protein
MHLTLLILPALAVAHVVMPRPAGPPAALLPSATPSNVPATTAIPPSPPAPTQDPNIEYAQLLQHVLQHVIRAPSFHLNFPPSRLNSTLTLDTDITRPREIVNGVATVLGSSDAPVVSTQWVETIIAGVRTWVEVIYTQTFAKVPDQLPTMILEGHIGMGTLTGQIGVTKTVQAGAMATAVMDGWVRNAVAAGVVAVGLMA